MLRTPPSERGNFRIRRWGLGLGTSPALADSVQSSGECYMQKNQALETNENALTPSTGAPTSTRLEANEPPVLTASDYELAHGEKLAATLDLDTWRPGADLVQMYERLANEIQDAVRQETLMQ